MFFDKMFDMNHDGKLDWMEQAAELSFMKMVMEDKKDNDDEEDDEESED